MALLARLFDFQPATTIVSADVDSEFNQLVNILNGTSTNKDALIKFSDAANSVLRVDQISTGLIQQWLQNGTEKARIANNGQLAIGTTQSGSGLNRLAINADANNAGVLVALQSTDTTVPFRIAHEGAGASSGNAVAFQISRFDGSVVQVYTKITAGGRLETPAGLPSVFANIPAAYITLGGQYLQQLNAVGNVGAGEDDLHSHTIAANVLANDGDSLYFSACGKILAAGTTKQLRMFFGGTALLTTGFFDPAVDFDWSMNGDITRIDSDSIVSNVICMVGDGVMGGNAALANRSTQVNSLSFTGTLTLKWTGADTDGVNDRVTQTMSVIRKFAKGG